VTDRQIHEALSDYQAAFNMLDAAAVAEFYDEPSAIVDGGVTTVFAKKDATRENMELLTQYYQSIGFTSAQPTRIDIEHVSPEMAEVDVGWTMHLGAESIQFATRYWIVHRRQGLRIASVLAYSEPRATDNR
jgi:ketosteroid isomerase-like protein